MGTCIPLLRWERSLLFVFKIYLARDPYHPYMPFKVTYSLEQVVLDFENIVVALRLITALTLWVWLYAVSNLLVHYTGPLYFD